MTLGGGKTDQYKGSSPNLWLALFQKSGLGSKAWEEELQVIDKA